MMNAHICVPAHTHKHAEVTHKHTYIYKLPKLIFTGFEKTKSLVYSKLAYT